MGAFDTLLTSWRSNPDAEATLSLCSHLSAAPREDIVREVGARAEQWHGQDGEVMLAVGRMYLDAGLLTEAQATLVNAGKVNPRDARAFRHLGEVLLRRGDAARAEKVLARAMQLGLNDADTKLWHDRSVVYVALQKRVGAQAVAAEVARTLPRKSLAPPEPVPVSPAPIPVAVASPWAEESPTVRKAPPNRPPPPGARPALVDPRQARPRSVPPPLPPAPPPPVAVGPPPRVPAGMEDDDETTVQGAPVYARALMGSAPTGSTTRRQPLGEPGAAALAATQPAPPQYQAPPAAAQRVTGSTQPFGAPVVPAIPRSSWEEPDDITGPTRPEDVANPTPEAVLESLARVGIYEPGGGAAPAWDAATPLKTRGSWVLILATVLVLGAGGGAYAYARKVKIERAATAQRLGDEVETMLQSAEMAQLTSSDAKLSKIFELDSRSPRAAKLWLKNRVLGALMLPTEARGIDSAVHRARSIDVPESEVAFGKIASFLVEGDLAGAAAVLPRYDKDAGKDAYYQLTAAAVLERAGDLRAIERYEAARALDPKLLIADVFLARLVLLELGPAKGKPVIEELKKKTGETPTTRALEALMWAVDPNRPKELPKTALLSAEDQKILVAPLLPIPAVVDAIQAIDAGLGEKAIAAIDSAITLSMSPAMATQLGFLAIKAGNEKLARKAALRALQFSALYPQARVLASRVALLSGRLDEAKKAIEELDPKGSDVAVVRAVIAYETLDGGELQSALEVLGVTDGKGPELAAFAAMPGVIMGSSLPPPEKIEAMANPQTPWGELVAVDAALTAGNLTLADKLVTAWGEGGARAVYALRVSRLRRYQDKLADAEKASASALEGTTTVAGLVERVFALVAHDQPAPARDLIAKYPSLLGPLAGWLRMFVDAKSGKAAEARSKASQLEPPSEEAPLLLRLVAARALAATKDRRAKGLVGMLERKLKGHPEVLLAAKDLK